MYHIPEIYMFRLTADYTVRKIPVGLKLNGTYKLLAYADDVTLLGDNIDTVKKTQTFIEVSKEVDIEAKAEKSGCILLFRHQNAEQNHDIRDS
jgi:hypothetical protein